MPDIINGFDGFAEYLRELETSFTNISYRPAWEKTAASISTKVADNFLKELDAAGNPWPPLAPSTVKRKGHAIRLVESGRLKQSSIVQGGVDHIEDISDEFLVFGTSAEYAMFHQKDESGVKPAPNIPQREFMAIDDPTAEKIAGHVADHAVNSLKRA